MNILIFLSIVSLVWGYDEHFISRCDPDGGDIPEYECKRVDVWRSTLLTGLHARDECRDLCYTRCRRLYGSYSGNQCIREGSVRSSYLCQCIKCRYCPQL